MAEIESKSEGTGFEIAIIGMAGRFPGAENIEQFWENIKNGVESITIFSEDELEEAGMDLQIIGNADYVKAYGILEDSDCFDALFFNYTPVVAQWMDPQMRILHECAWKALENAGYVPGADELSIGLYVGASPNFNWEVVSALSLKNNELAGWFANRISSDKDFISTRISYNLDLRGPSLTLYTACSTSLVAVDLACKGLLTAQCDIALAGGATLCYPFKRGYMYQERMIFSPDGHTRAFDKKANGSVFGQGAGIVVLKTLEDAVADRDYIYAVIKGTALNNDGNRKVGYTAPGIKGQAAVIKTAQHIAGIEPESISYIEAHGTGTNLGDPVEIKALKKAFDTDKKGFCALGTVKTNIGHLEAVAGVAGLIKTALMLKNEFIPPSLHFEHHNPEIDFENSPFFVNPEPKKWKRNKYPLRAGVSSFGIGGTNVHVVLEEFSEGTRGLAPLPDAHPSRNYQLILLSAKTPTALERMTKNLVNHFKNNPNINLADAAYTLQVGRKTFQYRKMMVCASVDEAAEILAKKSKKVQTFLTREENPSVIFIFAGLGSHYVNMGWDLYQKEPVFREEMDSCFKILKSIIGYDIKEILYQDDSGRGGYPYPPSPVNSPLERGAPQGRGVSPDIDQPEIAHPVIFIFEYALAKLLMKWGIKPRAMIGYSLGEYVAACISGVFSLEDALKVVTTRGQLLQKTLPGAMLSVPLPEKEIKTLATANKDIWLAIDNGPSCIVAGTSEAVKGFEDQMKKKRLICTEINNSHAVHSGLMQEIRKEFEHSVKKIKLNNPRIPYISNVSGDWITGEAAADPGYWGHHLCSTVRFSDGINQLLKEEHSVFIEIGPGRVLSNLVRLHVEANKNKDNKKTRQKQIPINLIRHQQENEADDSFLLNKIGHLWLYGIEVDWAEFYRGEERYRIPLPTYSFAKKRFNVEGSHFKALSDLLSRSETETVLEQKPGPEHELPAEMTLDEYDEEFEAPRNELEERIAGMWQQALGYEKVSVYDNFFRLNGDSLTATQLISQLQDMYGVEVSMREFFQEPTIAYLAKVVKELLMERIKALSEEELDKLTSQ
jgi:acyl transferase domain-containing protein